MLAEIIQPTRDLAAVPLSDLRGRVDAVDEGRVFGWAWDPVHPEARLAVHVYAADDLVAEAVADKPRVDLRRNGIGDGSHAFDVDVPLAAIGGRPLKVVAVHPDGGANLVLRSPSEEERAAEAAFSTPLGPILDRLETAIAVQRRMQIGHANSLRELTTASRQLADVAGGDGGVVRAIQELRDGQDAVAARLGELEVFMIRFDGLVGEFQQRLAALARQNGNGVRGHLLVLAGAVGILCGIAVAMAAGLS